MRRAISWLTLPILAFAVLGSANANGVGKDRTFDSDGIMIGPLEGGLSDVVVDGDDTVVTGNVLAMRLLPSGAADATFGGGDGIVPNQSDTITYPGLSPAAISLRTGGGYLVATGYPIENYQAPPSWDAAVVALDDAGDLDTGFGGGDGIALVSTPNDESVTSMVVDPDGRILVGATETIGGGDTQFEVVRFSSTGILDAAFGGGDGVDTYDAGPGNWDHVTDITTTSTGQPVVVGTSDAIDGSSTMVVALLGLDGTPDPSFSGDGYATPHIQDHSAGAGIAVVDGGFVVGAAAWGTPTKPTQHITDLIDFAIVRLQADGTLDHAFGARHGFTIKSLGGNDKAADLTLLSDGSFLEIGSADSDYGLLRFTKTGLVDPLFGVVRTDLDQSLDGASAVAVLDDGRFVVVGSSYAALPCVGGSCYTTYISAVRYKDPGLACTLIGTPTTDNMDGTPGPDVICVLGGNNVVHALGGADYVYAPSYGKTGDDRFYGGGGPDHLYGGEGDDLLNGGAGSDTCVGGSGKDTLISCP